jgi:hypothetical protein
MDRLRFLFVVHNHQPLGNFDSVMEVLTERAYRPFLSAVRDRRTLKLTVHLSGPLLLWLEKRARDYFDLVGELVERGQVELMLGGMYEPILAAIPPDDRVAQIALMSDLVRSRFGVRPRGLWLAERVWEAGIIPALAEAGIEYTLMDDRAFRVSGFPPERLHDYYLTEEDGQRIAVFPIDRRLRYLIPFRPPAELEAYLHSIAQGGGRLAVAADDGEKFGGWPNTAKWVYEDGWLKQFLDLVESPGDWMITQTLGEAFDDVPPAGLCYLPTASYAEMEEWTLGPEGARQFAELRAQIGTHSDRLDANLRGGHWKHFLVRYPEANRAHKKGLVLGRLIRSRRRTNPATRDILAAQCNDAYWHGIFGGLYLPHLRNEIWRHLARAEARIRRQQHLQVEPLDIDLDGHPEVWVHGRSFSAQVQPHRGGRLVEWTVFAAETNFLNTLTRRPEAYHATIRAATSRQAAQGPEGIPGIHDLQREATADLANALIYDRWERGAFLDHFFTDADPLSAWAAARLDERGDFTDARWAWQQTSSGVALDRLGRVAVHAERDQPILLSKEYVFTEERRLEVRYRITNKGPAPLAVRFGVELNFFIPGLTFGHAHLVTDDQTVLLDTPASKAGVKTFSVAASNNGHCLRIELAEPATLHGHLVATVAQSEQGFERTVQGLAVMPSWELSVDPGREWTGSVRVGLARAPAGAKRRAGARAA